MGEIVIKIFDYQGDKLLKLYLTVLKSCTQKLFKIKTNLSLKQCTFFFPSAAKRSQMLSEDTHKTSNIANALKQIKQMKEFTILKRARPLL